MGAHLLKPTVIAFALGTLLVSTLSQAARPGVTDEEAANTAAAREAYFQQRRVNPSNAEFNAAAARLQAYKQYTSASKTASATHTIDSVGHTETWKSIGPSTIVGGQTPTSATAQSRSNVAGRVSSIAIDPIDNAVYAGGAQGGVWRSLNNGASWTPLTDFLGSLAVGTIIVAPGAHAPNQGTLYLGTGEGNYSGDTYGGNGVYKSSDSGRTWQGPLGAAQFTGRSVGTIAVDRANPNHVMAGSTSGYYGIAGVLYPTLPTRGVYSSNDGGTTWTLSASAPAVARIAQIVQDPTTATTWWATVSIYNTTGGALIKSTDNGTTWAKVDGVAMGLPAAKAPNGSLTRAALSTSTAAGKTVLYYATSETPASQAQTGNGGTLYVSTDGGLTWANKPNADGFCQGQCTYDMPVYTPPEASTTVYTGGAGDSGALPSSFMNSTDGGATFADEMVGIDGNSALHADMHAITSWPGQPNNIWVGNDGGVFNSTDGGQHWTSVNTTLQLTQFQGCDLHPTDPNAAYGGTQDNGTEGYLGASAWSHSDDGDGGFALIDQSNPGNVAHTYYNQSNNLIYAAVATNGVASTPVDYQNGAGYVNGYISSGINGTDNVLFYAPMQLDHGVTSTLYFGTDHLYIAPDFFNQAVAATNAANATPPDPNYPVFTALNGGATLSPPVPPSADGGAISAIQSVQNVLPGQPAKVIFVGTSTGQMWASSNGGVSFAQIDLTGGVPVAQQYVSSIVVDPRNPNIVFASRAGFTGALPAHNVRRSTDGGVTWNDASSGLPDIPVNSLIFDPTFPNQVWAGTDIGMYLSADGGNSWIPYNQGVPNVAVFSLAANHQTHTILACTHGRGAFELNLDAIFIDGFDGR
ncbi:MAG: hypothetical protein ABI748_02095 [Dokdonella sp.]